MNIAQVVMEYLPLNMQHVYLAHNIFVLVCQVFEGSREGGTVDP